MLQSNRVLQKEQAELFSIQKKLERFLPVIQEALNSLKVLGIPFPRTPITVVFHRWRNCISSRMWWACKALQWNALLPEIPS